MNLRLLLVLITVLSYVAIGVTWIMTTTTDEIGDEAPPFFYTLSPDDLRNIEISTGDTVTSWSLREDVRRWYFDDLNDILVATVEAQRRLVETERLQDGRDRAFHDVVEECLYWRFVTRHVRCEVSV